MHDEQQPPTGGKSDEDSEVESSERAAWVGAAGVSGEHVIAGERLPRLHWLLMILGPVGLAIAIMASLWSSSRQVLRSVNVQVETRWVAGEQLAIRAQLVGTDLKPLDEPVEIWLRYIAADGSMSELGSLTRVDAGLAQGVFTAPGAGQLVLHYETGAQSAIEPFDEFIDVELVKVREQAAGRQVVSENMLQWADDTDEQPEDVRIDLRPASRLLAGFNNRLFVRVTDPKGKPLSAKERAQIQILLASGEFDGLTGDSDKPPIIHEAKLDALGLTSFSGVLSSDTVRFEVRLAGPDKKAETETDSPETETDSPKPDSPEPDSPKPDPSAAEPKQPPPDQPGTEPKTPGSPPSDEQSPPDQPRYLSGPKRRLRFVSHAGTVRLYASTDFARPGDEIEITVDAISTRRAAFVDVHGPSGAWLDTLTPPLTVPQQRKWTVPPHFAEAGDTGPFIQFEAYQSILRPEDSSAIARVQLAPAGRDRAASLEPLIERQREQLSLPRIDRQFEVERERAYLDHVEAQHRAKSLSDDEVERARAFLIGSLEAVVHGPPQALNTRAREEATLMSFKREWTMGIRWFLLGGGMLFIVVMAAMVWRNQRKLEAQTSDALGLVEGSPGGSVLDDDAFADQSLAIVRARRQILARGVLSIALMAAALLLTVAMLESLVWEY